MTNQELNTINIKGKEYVPVSERIRYFNENYPQGSISTQLVSDVESDNIVIKAVIYPDTEHKRFFTGYSQATKGDGYINKTSALENAETSAVGRALGMMGIGVLDSIASADEMKKATAKPQNAPTNTYICEECGTTIPPHRVEASMAKFGRSICYACETKGATV